jgi:predicted AAA+ superfamily ATPase
MVNLNHKFTDSRHKLEIVIGAKRSGKTLYLVQLAVKHLKRRGVSGLVFSNFGIGEELHDDYWNYSYPAESLLLIDEVGIIHDNRDFKKFEGACRDFYKNQGKNKLFICLSSQTVDVDKKIRDLADNIYLVERKFEFFRLISRYKQVIRLEKSKTDKGGEELVQTWKQSGRVSFSLYATVVHKAGKLYDTLRKVSKQSYDGLSSVATNALSVRR